MQPTIILVIAVTTLVCVTTADADEYAVPHFRYPNQGDAPLRKKALARQGQGNDREVVFNSNPLLPPPPIQHRYSLGQVCKADLDRHCASSLGRNRSPYSPAAVACLDASSRDLAPDCRQWHEARNACSQELRDASKSADGCSEACREYCAPGGSLLFCMRAIGREMVAVTSRACHDSDFAKSVVTSLRRRK